MSTETVYRQNYDILATTLANSEMLRQTAIAVAGVAAGITPSGAVPAANFATYNAAIASAESAHATRSATARRTERLANGASN